MRASAEQTIESEFGLADTQTRHLSELSECFEIWGNKPLLKRVYGSIFQRLAAAAKGHQPIVELGSGIAAIKATLPECICTDFVRTPWAERVESAYQLSFSGGDIGAIIMLDVFHHLEYPGSALEECRRVLKSGGRLLICDPYISLLGRLVYGLAHHEPIGWNDPITPCRSASDTGGVSNYYAAQGNLTRIFFRGEYPEILDGWKVVDKVRFESFSYAGSGGFRGPQLYPEKLYPAVQALDKLCSRIPGLFSMRALVVLEKVH